jgi:hypothetical protein
VIAGPADGFFLLFRLPASPGCSAARKEEEDEEDEEVAALAAAADAVGRGVENGRKFKREERNGQQTELQATGAHDTIQSDPPTTNVVMQRGRKEEKTETNSGENDYTSPSLHIPGRSTLGGFSVWCSLRPCNGNGGCSQLREKQSEFQWCSNRAWLKKEEKADFQRKRDAIV